MTFMALDFGERRVGIATSDSGILATPHSILKRTTKKKDFAHLQQLIKKLGITQIIVGLPYSLNPQNDPEKIGPQAKRVIKYITAMSEVIDTPVEFFDETYSTAEAKDYMRATAQQNKHVDATAAAVILQKYLDYYKDIYENIS